MTSLLATIALLLAFAQTPYLHAAFAPEDVALMERVRWCESRHDPAAQNPVSSAAGDFQVTRGTWAAAREGLARLGVTLPPFEEGRYDRRHNTTAAAWLLYHGGGIGHWESSREGCWG